MHTIEGLKGGVALVMATMLLLNGCFSEPAESDIGLLFRAKRPILERLVEMSNEDYERTSVTRIAPDFTRLENNWGWPRPENELGMSVERWEEYKKLFQAAEVHTGLDRAGEDSEGVMFFVWGFGIADNSQSKGIVYFPKPPLNIAVESQRVTYKPLADGWYYYEWATW